MEPLLLWHQSQGQFCKESTTGLTAEPKLPEGLTFYVSFHLDPSHKWQQLRIAVAPPIENRILQISG